MIMTAASDSLFPLQTLFYSKCNTAATPLDRYDGSTNVPVSSITVQVHALH